MGQLVGGQPIIRQDATGAVFTSLSSSAVFVRTNALKVRLRGVEGSVAMKLRSDLTINANAFYVHGKDLRTGSAAQSGKRYSACYGIRRYQVGTQPAHPRWIELYSNFAAPQRRFSDNDISQARIGGIRTREEIAGFFNGGAVARGLVRNGILLRYWRNAGAGATARAWTRTSAQSIIQEESRICALEFARRFPRRRAFVDHRHSRKHSR